MSLTSSALLNALAYLNHAYKDQHRRMGPLSVLHPLRATAILSRTVEKVNMLDLLTELLHDKHEDIKASNYPEDKFGEDY
jgi:(p)ppGpp synthase/HD superfamily hydrolase